MSYDLQPGSFTAWANEVFGESEPYCECNHPKSEHRDGYCRDCCGCLECASNYCTEFREE